MGILGIGTTKSLVKPATLYANDVIYFLLYIVLSTKCVNIMCAELLRMRRGLEDYREFKLLHNYTLAAVTQYM